MFHDLQLLQKPQLLPIQKPAKMGGMLTSCRNRRLCSPLWKGSMKWLDLLLTLTRALVWGLLVSLLCQSKESFLFLLPSPLLLPIFSSLSPSSSFSSCNNFPYNYSCYNYTCNYFLTHIVIDYIKGCECCYLFHLLGMHIVVLCQVVLVSGVLNIDCYVL